MFLQHLGISWLPLATVTPPAVDPGALSDSWRRAFGVFWGLLPMLAEDGRMAEKMLKNWLKWLNNGWEWSLFLCVLEFFAVLDEFDGAWRVIFSCQRAVLEGLHSAVKRIWSGAHGVPVAMVLFEAQHITASPCNAHGGYPVPASGKGAWLQLDAWFSSNGGACGAKRDPQGEHEEFSMYQHDTMRCIIQPHSMSIEFLMLTQFNSPQVPSLVTPGLS